MAGAAPRPDPVVDVAQYPVAVRHQGVPDSDHGLQACIASVDFGPALGIGSQGIERMAAVELGLAPGTVSQGIKRSASMAAGSSSDSMLNPYASTVLRGPPSNHDALWNSFNEPNIPGEGIYFALLQSHASSRRCVGVNRWGHSQILFCRYQLRDYVKTKNEFVLHPKLCQQLYAEIERILPALEVCFDVNNHPSDIYSSVLSGAAHILPGVVCTAPRFISRAARAELDAKAVILWEWISTENSSRIRMLQSFQANDGLSLVCARHQAAMSRFRYEGNKSFTPLSPQVSLATFQECVQLANRLQVP